MKFLFASALSRNQRYFCANFQHVSYLAGVHLRTLCDSQGNVSNNAIFRPSRVVILSRITRYEFEKLRYKGVSEEEFKQKLEKKRSDYHTLVERHITHYSFVNHMQTSLLKHGIETVVVNRPKFTKDLQNWADVVFTAGGDGTFLDAASKILSRDKPVIGINTDPSRSEGNLCVALKDHYTNCQFDVILNKLLEGNFRWMFRQRIRITMSGYHANDNPIELSNQQLQFLEHRYTEHVKEHEMCARPHYLKGVTHDRILPIRALNEVFLGECLSSRVSYYELSLDGKPGEKQKSSGVTVCTGTGSTSWNFNINHIHSESVAHILEIANQLGNCQHPTDDESFVKAVADNFNESLVFGPSEPYMGYTVRDPLINRVFQVLHPRGKVKKIQLVSRMWDASLVVDGGCSFRFNDGAVATMEICDEDALRTVAFD